MKHYLFGLGAMLVGAGLMFVLMHGEVRAEGNVEVYCENISVKQFSQTIAYCKIKDLTCIINGRGTSCVRR